MNKERRKTLQTFIKQVDDLRDRADALRNEIDEIREEEQEYFDNMPENFQEGDKGQKAQEAIDAMENAGSDLECFDWDSIIGYLETAAE